MLIALFGAIVSSVVYIVIDDIWKTHKKAVKRKQRRKDKQGDA